MRSLISKRMLSIVNSVKSRNIKITVLCTSLRESIALNKAWVNQFYSVFFGLFEQGSFLHEHARPLDKQCAWRLTTGSALIKTACLKAIIAIIFLVGLGQMCSLQKTLTWSHCAFTIAFFTSANHNYDHQQWTLKHTSTQNGSKSTNHRSQIFSCLFFSKFYCWPMKMPLYWNIITVPSKM